MFILDQRIQSDSILICELELCQLRIQNDSRYPWLVLVPKLEGVTEVHELTVEHQYQLIQESSLVANALKQVTACKKVNIANLGNVVSQLHWHVVARSEDDQTWPGPIWGLGVSIPYGKEQLDNLINAIKEKLDVPR